MAVLWTACAVFIPLLAWKFVACLPVLVAWIQLEQLPHPPRKLLAGNFKPGRLDQPHLQWLKWHKEIGGLFCSRLFWRHLVIITDPAIAAQLIQIDESRQIDKLRGPYQRFQMLADPDHPSMFTSLTNDYWRTVRKGLAPAFNTANIRQGFGNIVDIMQTVVKFLRSEGPTPSQDIDVIAARAALDGISRSGFGYNMDCCKDLGAPPEASPYIASLDASIYAVRKWMLAPWFLRYFSWMPAARKDMAALRRLRQLNMKLVKQLRAHPPPASTLGAHMLKLVDPKTSLPLTDQQLLGEITLMYFAGWDTSAHTIAFTCGLIAEHPEAENKIAAELESIGLLASEREPSPRQIVHDDLALLTYTSAVIKESMRMFPVGAMGTLRTSKQPLQVGGFTMPPDTPFILHFYAMFNSPTYWDQPEVFSPERWLEPDAEMMPAAASAAAGLDQKGSSQPTEDRAHEVGSTEEMAHLTAQQTSSSQRTKRFFPFSEGLRNCIGQNLARMTVLTFVAVLCSHFKLRMADKMGGLEGVRAKQRVNMTMKPGDGMHLHFIPRSPH